MIEKTDVKPDTFAPAFDARNLQMLESVLGRERFLSAIERFKCELEMRISAITERSTRATEKGAHAHKLVGTAGVMGLRELADASRRLELAVVQKGDLQLCVDSLVAAANRARAELEVLSVAK